MTTYSISLDDVDLALLPLHTYKCNDFLKKEHYQFEIMKKEKEPTEESPPILYKCHTCAIDVPAAFAREHGASVKHRANARIASVAARRMRGLVAAVHPPVVRQPQGRFCTHCVSTVGDQDKTHDKTKEHRVAVMHDKLLTELMNAYVGDDHDMNSGESSDSDDDDRLEIVKERKEKQIIDKTLGSVNHKVNGSDIEVKREVGVLSNVKTKVKELSIKIDKPKIDDKNKTNTKTNKDKIETENNTKIEMAIKNDQSNIKLAQFKVEHIEFVTKNNELVKVSIDHYHSFVRRDNKTECIVCKTTFHSEDANSHMFSVKHLNLMPSTMIDEHCMRKINDVYSHCLLCNQMVKNANVNKHHLTAFHGERKKLAVTGYTKKTFSLPALTPEATTSFWDPINRYVEDGTTINHDADGKKSQTKYTTEEKLQNITNSLKKTPNISAEMAQPENKAIVKISEQKRVADNNGVIESKIEKKENSENNETKTNVDWPVIYPYEVTDHGGSVRCVICDCKVPNTPGNRKTHLKGSNHFKNVKTKRLLHPYEACETGCPGWYVRCVLCDRRVLNTLYERQDHLTDTYHILNAMQCEEDD